MSILRLDADTRQYLSQTCADAEEAIAERDPRFTLPDAGYGSTCRDRDEGPPARMSQRERDQAVMLYRWVQAGMTAHAALARMARMGY